MAPALRRALLALAAAIRYEASGIGEGSRRLPATLAHAARLRPGKNPPSVSSASGGLSFLRTPAMMAARAGVNPATLRGRVTPEMERLLASVPESMRSKIPELLDSPEFNAMAEKAGMGHLLRGGLPNMEEGGAEGDEDGGAGA